MLGISKIQHHIVVVEDDHAMARLIETILVGDGHAVTLCASGSDGMANALDPSVDLLMLDLGLPDVDGIDVARFVRSRSSVPILMLTARSDVSSRVKGLDAGADDYLSKPFNPEEMRARVRSIIRRVSIDGAIANSTEELLSIAGWRLNQQKKEIVAPSGQGTQLTEREYLIVASLIHSAGSIVTRDILQRQVSGRQWTLEDRSLDVHISHIRKKLESVSEGEAPIRTVRGKGFCFQP